MSTNPTAQQSTSQGQLLWVSISDSRATFKQIDWTAVFDDEDTLDLLYAATLNITDDDGKSVCLLYEKSLC